MKATSQPAVIGRKPGVVAMPGVRGDRFVAPLFFLNVSCLVVLHLSHAWPVAWSWMPPWSRAASIGLCAGLWAAAFLALGYRTTSRPPARRASMPKGARADIGPGRTAPPSPDRASPLWDRDLDS